MSWACFVGELSGQEVPSRERWQPIRTAPDCGWRGPLGKGLKVCCVLGLQVLCQDLPSEGEQPQTPRPGIPRCFSGRAKGAGDKGFPQAAQPGPVSASPRRRGRSPWWGPSSPPSRPQPTRHPSPFPAPADCPRGLRVRPAQVDRCPLPCSPLQAGNSPSWGGGWCSLSRDCEPTAPGRDCSLLDHSQGLLAAGETHRLLVNR